MADKDYIIKPALCLHCGYLADRAGDFAGHGPPKPDDVMMCLACGQFMVFGPKMELERLEFETFKTLSIEEKQDMVRLKIHWLMLPDDERRKMRERGGRT